MNKYFAFIETEAALDAEFDKELAAHPLAVACETAAWLKEQGGVSLDEYRTARMRRLIEALAVRLPSLGSCYTRGHEGRVATWAGPGGKNLCADCHKKLVEG